MLELDSELTPLTDQQKRDGLNAATSVFALHHQDPETCYRIYGYQIRGPLNLSRDDEPLIEIWEEAESAAIDAAFPDRHPADLSLVYHADHGGVAPPA
jgi:hypothetical protein